MQKVNSLPPYRWSTSELGAFFVENRSDFVAHAKRVTGTSSQAEELVQESLIRVLLACPELESVDHALAYFHRVIENLSIDLLRRQGRQPQLVMLDDATSQVEAKWSFNPDFTEAIIAADDAAIIREAIALLSPAERAALVMWELDGRSAQEIAQELGIKESAVRHTLARARASLRRVLSERIIDEELGLTALDVLSVGYRKSAALAKKSSKIALSLLLVFSAFLGFNSLAPGDFVERDSASTLERPIAEQKRSAIESETSPSGGANNLTPSAGEEVEDADEVATTQKTKDSFDASRALALAMASLDAEEIPAGFKVFDSLGARGLLFVGQQRMIATETGLLLSNIVSTKSGATNVLIDQSVVLDAFGTSYVAGVSVGIRGGWQPLRLSYVSSDIERLASGDYLLTAMMMVDSAVETAVKVSTGTSGTDLNSAPTSIATRVLLDPTKTKILAQVVFVSADSQGDGA